MRKPRIPTVAYNTVTLNLNPINLQVPTLKIQLLMRPLSGSIKGFSQEHKPMSFGTWTILTGHNCPAMPQKLEFIHKLLRNSKSVFKKHSFMYYSVKRFINEWFIQR